MNGSLYTADRATHRRILLTAAAAVTLVVLIGLGARVPIANGLAAAPPAAEKQEPAIVPLATARACIVTPYSNGCCVA
jgi:hypothetical protein